MFIDKVSEQSRVIIKWRLDGPWMVNEKWDGIDEEEFEEEVCQQLYSKSDQMLYTFKEREKKDL